MKTQSLIFLLFVSLILPASLTAEEQVKPFTLNGKTVPEIVATVNGVSLASKLIERELYAFQLRAKQMGREIKPSDEVTIARELIKAAIEQELVVQKAKSLNINITEEKINNQLKNVEDQFPSHEGFLTALAFQHLSIESLKEKIHRTLLEDELMRREIAPKVKVDDEDLKNYYKENQIQFTRPTLYRVRHILIATLKPSGKLDDETSRKKAERLTKVINEEAKENADSILKKIKAGENFAELAKQFSEDDASKVKGGMLGDLHPESTIPQIGEAMVKLTEGATSDIIESQYGFHILKLDKIIPSQLIPFSAAKTDIMNLQLKIKTQKLFKIYLTELRKQAEIKIFL